MNLADKSQPAIEPLCLDTSCTTVTTSDFRTFFELAPDPCLVLDRNLQIVAVNDAYLHATMTRHEEIMGRGIFEVFPDNPDDPLATGVRNLSASLDRVLKNLVTDVMEVQKYDMRRPVADGSSFEERYWSPINTPIFGTDNEIVFILFRLQDVTEYVRLRQKRIDAENLAEELRLRAVQLEAERYAKSQEVEEINMKLQRANEVLEIQNEKLQELNRLLEVEAAARVQIKDALDAVNAELERSNKELELFASVTSHDLQEPLHTITSYVELLEYKYKGKLDQQADMYIHFIVDGSTHMHMMINDLLAYSRVGSKAKSLGPVKMDSVLDQALGNLRKSIAESNTTIDREELPEVEGDDGQLTQLLQNLIGNALKFRKKDVPFQVRISCSPSGNEWLFGVSDNGIGIEDRFFDQIFEIFRRLHTREEYEGSGIGLAICRKIIEHHGGRIWVESKFGEGSSFYFTLPMRGESHGA